MNYYELIGLDTEANSSEIETALDTHYDQWRALVTNHDPKVVSEANQALMTIEEIRKTLLDPNKRKEYDRALNSIGGLEDPSTIPAISGFGAGWMAPPHQRASGQAAQQMETDDAHTWTCSSCKKKYPVGTRFCKSCGNQLGVDCPNCGRLTYINNRFCQDCGVDIQEAIKQKEAEARIAEKKRVLQLQEEGYLEQFRNKVELAEKYSKLAYWIFPPIGLVLWPIGLYHSITGLSLPSTPGDEYYREDLKKNEAKNIYLISDPSNNYCIRHV